MQTSRPVQILKDILATLIVIVFMFPIFWWSLSSIKPYTAIFNKDGPVYFDFQPTLQNYEVTLLGKSRIESNLESGGTSGAGGGSSYDSRETILQSIIVAVGSTILTIVLSTLASYALSRLPMRGKQHFLFWILSQRFMPPIAAVIPIMFMFRDMALLDTLTGLIIAHTLINIPIAVLLLKSFLDDVPKEIDEAAMIDGATRLQTFRRIILPMIKGGVAATAVLCFIVSWTEFLLSLYLTTSIRTLPVKISTFVTSTGTEWGFITALGTSAIVPSFIFILLVQRHLVRGLTLGSLKD
ncbi:carbohydrate ABC transporter permease [Gellertiella hungarica]|uniref:Maltose/maltodextrin transport system permease protein MalG n=1 Tax=Gellertiella hungarica TaxID=1572859 RepID=A0A7W6NJP6_9HYPH|nr:carbohydrate ABC transporter permease [Gellertiella hungarica]MBB4063714.1 multiple sugar transport system permease protein [Gellertiella hungarica]